MIRKKRRGDEGSSNEWLNTYADMVTLLLTFFAALLSMSTVNQEKFEAFIQSFSNLPPEKIEEIIENAGQGSGDGQGLSADEISQAINELYEKLNSYVFMNGMDDSVSIRKVDDTVYIRFDSSVFFDPDKYTIRQGGYEALAFVGDGIKEYEKMIKVVAICGHTATVGDIPNDSVSDWMLSGERAAVVAMYFEKQKLIDPKKLLLMGYGKNLPISGNDTEEGRMENRRVELAIIGTSSDISFNPYDGLSNLYTLSADQETTNDSDNNIDQTSETAKPVDIQKNVSPYD